MYLSFPHLFMGAIPTLHRTAGKSKGDQAKWGLQCVKLHLLTQPVTRSLPNAGSSVYSADLCPSVSHFSDATAPRDT